MDNTNGEISKCVEATQVPHRQRSLQIAALCLVLAALVGSGLAILAVNRQNRASSSSVPATEPTNSRFAVDMMNVDLAIQYPDGKSSEIYFNTPHAHVEGALPGALPAVSIMTGTAVTDDFSAWQETGSTISILDQRVAVRTLNGDPFAVSWTEPNGLDVAVIGEGYASEDFKRMAHRVRRMDETEWAAAVREKNLDAVRDRATDASVEVPTSAGSD